MSFSAKYRGTEFGLPDEDQKPGKPPRQSGGRGGGLGDIIVSIVAVVAVAGILGSVAWIYLRSQPGAAASSEPSREPSVAVERFVELMSRKPPLPMRIDYQLVVQTAAGAIGVTGVANVSGADSAGRLTITRAGEEATADYVQKKGKTYVRLPGGAWRLGESKDVTEPAFAFRDLTAAELEEAGQVEHGGRMLYRLRAREWPGTDPDQQLAAGGEARLDEWSYDVYVTDLGVPVSIEFDAVASTVKDGETLTIGMQGTFTISRFSKPVGINAPEV